MAEAEAALAVARAERDAALAVAAERDRVIEAQRVAMRLLEAAPVSVPEGPVVDPVSDVEAPVVDPVSDVDAPELRPRSFWGRLFGRPGG